MIPTKPDTAAFPLPTDSCSDGRRGLTIRAEFAKVAMQGLLAGGHHTSAVPEEAVRQADRLIAALNEPKT